MIAWLKGTVLHLDGNEVILDVQGTGYRIIIGENLLLQQQYKAGETKEIVIYTSVREDAITLFGFESFEARKLFILLLGVNGVGPKVGVKIIDQLPVRLIIQSISNNDFTPFLKVSGVGKKTAQRLVLDLQGKIEAFILADREQGKGSQATASPTEVGAGSTYILADTKSALSNLGYAERDAEAAIHKHLRPGMELDELIRKCLADLNRSAN